MQKIRLPLLCQTRRDHKSKQIGNLKSFFKSKMSPESFQDFLVVCTWLVCIFKIYLVENECLGHLESKIINGLSEEEWIEPQQRKKPLVDDDDGESEESQEHGTPITKKTKPTERMLQRTKLLFGSRSKSGYHRKSLKSVFLEKRATSDSFITDIGYVL